MIRFYSFFPAKAKAKHKLSHGSTLILQDDELDPRRRRGSSSKCDPYIMKSQFEKDRIHRAAEQCIARQKVNDG